MLLATRHAESGQFDLVFCLAEIISLPEAMDLLIDWHRRVRAEPPSWDEYHEKMRQEQRVVLRINIEKCLEAGYGQVVVVSNERKSLSKIKELVSQKLSQADPGLHLIHGGDRDRRGRHRGDCPGIQG